MIRRRNYVLVAATRIERVVGAVEVLEARDDVAGACPPLAVLFCRSTIARASGCPYREQPLAAVPTGTGGPLKSRILCVRVARR